MLLFWHSRVGLYEFKTKSWTCWRSSSFHWICNEAVDGSVCLHAFPQFHHFPLFSPLSHCQSTWMQRQHILLVDPHPLFNPPYSNLDYFTQFFALSIYFFFVLPFSFTFSLNILFYFFFLSILINLFMTFPVCDGAVINIQLRRSHKVCSFTFVYKQINIKIKDVKN